MTKLIRIIMFIAVTLSTTNSFGLHRGLNTPETTIPKPFTIETVGQGKPILFLPGFSTPGSIWKETVENLTLERKSYFVSYAGFNGNEPIKMPWYSNIKNSIIKYVKDNNISDIIIIGHSMGGNLAIDIASALPNKVSKIIIVDALPCMREVMMPNVPAESLLYESPYNKQMLEMEDQKFKNMASMMASNMTLNKEKVDVLTNWILEADRKTWIYGYTDLLKLDLRDTLSKIKCETLIIGASFPNVEIAQKNYENQYSKLTNKTLVMASNSKHFIMFDQPKWLYKTINDFLVNEKK